MTPSGEIRVGPVDLGDDAVARSVLELQRASYAVEAALIADDRIPGLTETQDELRAAGETWLGAYGVGDRLVGAVSWKVGEDSVVDIHRLVVAPDAFRRGVATALLDALDARFPGRPMVVSTGSANTPALDLYRRRGFAVAREREVIPGLFVTELERPGA